LARGLWRDDKGACRLAKLRRLYAARFFLRGMAPSNRR